MIQKKDGSLGRAGILEARWISVVDRHIGPATCGYERVGELVIATLTIVSV